jgi:nucleotide-binding universal stress UspA family protein
MPLGRYASYPILISRSQELAMIPIQTILHPTDFSDHAQFAFRLACSLARDHGARVIVLHVAPPPLATLAGQAALPPLPEEFGREELEEKLRRLEAPQPTVPLERRLVVGEAVEEILRLAQTTPCDLIVMGTHGRTGLGRLLMGSVAEQVVRKAPCPVLTVRTPFPDTSPAPGMPPQGTATV